MAKTKTIVKPPKETKLCISCGEEKVSEGSANKFYKHNNPYLAANVGVCKACVEKVGATNDMEEIHKMLQLLDLPLLPDKWEACNAADNTLIEYVGSGKGLNNPKATIDGVRIYEMRYKDSPSYNPVEDVVGYIYTTNEQLSEYSALFGENWSKDELTAMNKELEEMLVKYGGKKDDIAILDVYVELILTKWLSRKAYNSNDPKTGRELSKRRSELLKENGLSLSDIKNKSDEESLGSRIDFAEDRPIIPDKKYYDVDGIRFMWDKLCKHMERFVGAEKSSVDDDYEEMQSYVDENGSYVEGME